MRRKHLPSGKNLFIYKLVKGELLNHSAPTDWRLAFVEYCVLVNKMWAVPGKYPYCGITQCLLSFIRRSTESTNRLTHNNRETDDGSLPSHSDITRKCREVLHSIAVCRHIKSTAQIRPSAKPCSQQFYVKL